MVLHEVQTMAELNKSGNARQHRMEVSISDGSLDQSAASEAGGCSMGAGGGSGSLVGEAIGGTGDLASGWRFNIGVPRLSFRIGGGESLTPAMPGPYGIQPSC